MRPAHMGLIRMNPLLADRAISLRRLFDSGTLEAYRPAVL
jgi:hypothetical protein